ncbi:MAG: sigma-54 dependent transcriptional regulator [Candidatus Aminicenantes bacterium]|nr:sigma-54 dependent transcriptional regulator [Candidatus Aminicenantes bacterium]
MKFKILIVDDEQNIRDIFSLLLAEQGFAVESAANGREGLARALTFVPDVLLLDMNLPDMSGLDVLAGVRERLPSCRVIVITAFGTIRNAVEATKRGAYAYLEKPVDNEELFLLIERALEVKRLEAEVEGLRAELSSRYRFTEIVGTSARMNSIFQMMDRIARVDGTLLLTGESGTGKELVARALHFAGPRREGPFVVVNCGAIPRDLIESEFFGHSKGAFTDAKTESTGKFEMAQRGTIFLDEIGELPLEAQVKLLRALGEREIVKVGGTRTIPVDVRVIAATNKDLESEVRKGAFREDLYFRLAVLSLRLPPLRERAEDIPLLSEHFLRKYGKELRKEIQALSPDFLDALMDYAWPGNVRELENVIYEAMVHAEGDRLDVSILPARIRGAGFRGRDEAEGPPHGDSDATAGSLLDAAHTAADSTARALIEKALQEAGGNRTLAAQRLGISRKTLFNKMKALGIG